jgi:hypothetical protein
LFLFLISSFIFISHIFLFHVNKRLLLMGLRKKVHGQGLSFDFLNLLFLNPSLFHDLFSYSNFDFFLSSNVLFLLFVQVHKLGFDLGKYCEL